MKTINPLVLDDGGTVDIHEDEDREGYVVVVSRRDSGLCPPASTSDSSSPVRRWRRLSNIRLYLTREETKLLGSWLLQLAGPEGTYFE